jgi:hypothetical protein
MTAQPQQYELPEASWATAPRIAPDTLESAVAGAAESAPSAAQMAALAPASALADGCLCFEDEFGGFVVVPIARPAMRIGRGLAAGISFEDPTVSRRHALVTREAERVRVLDDRSLNGLFVNGVRVRSRVLEDGDVIGVGRHRLHYLRRPELVGGEDAGEPALQAA